MRSSSRLFPVALISAELIGDLTEDVYLLKPGRGQDSSVRVAVTRINDPSQAGHKPPIVLLHGLFCNRHQWITGEPKGLGASLARAGYDVWLPELRGHGLSPANQNYHGNRAEDFWRDDLPAANDFIIEQTGLRPVWVGHGWSGMLIVAALGLGAIPSSRLAGLAILAPRFSHPSSMSWMPGFHVWSRWRLKKKELVGSGIAEGPEHEPAGLMLERLIWTQRTGVWSLSKKAQHSAWPGVERVDLPLAVVLPKTGAARVHKDAMLLMDHWGRGAKALTLDVPAENRGELLDPFVVTLEQGGHGLVQDALEAWFDELDLTRQSLQLRE